MIRPDMFNARLGGHGRGRARTVAFRGSRGHWTRPHAGVVVPRIKRHKKEDAGISGRTLPLC